MGAAAVESPAPGGMPGTGGMPGVGEIPGAGEMPGAGEIPGAGEMPGAGAEESPDGAELPGLGDPPTTSRPRIPSPPITLAEAGLSSEFVSDLLLKHLYVQGARTGIQLTRQIRLPFHLVDEELLDLQQRRFIEVRATGGAGRSGYTFDLTTAGRERAREALAASQYVGAAPVPFAQYRDWVEAQSVRAMRVTRERVRTGLGEVVLEEELFEQLGPAINSARSLFLYGAPGNGKTRIAELVARLLGEEGVYVPYAVEVDGQIMIIFDPVHHRPLDEEEEALGADALLFRRGEPYDQRYVRVARPVVVTGGELTLDQLDLQYDRYTKVYRAPFQVKADGGVLIIDDLGRQRVPPRELLNRWIVPLERRRDYLTLHTGVKFPVPFDCLLIFATNLDPVELVDEAFMRRIHYKIQVSDPGRAAYEEIFRRDCVERGIRYDAAAVDYLFLRYYEGAGIAPRGCHPRDLLDHLEDIAKYEEREPRLEEELLDRACQTYFLAMSSTAIEPSNKGRSG
jgi:predicted ATPase with chaperone activity